MRKIDEIKNMDVEQLAEFIICESAYEDVDYDWEEEDADWSYESEGEWEDVDEGGYVWEGGRTEGGGAEG